MTVTPAEEVAAAQALGRLAARVGAPITDNPYTGDTPDGRVLRYSWGIAYIRAGGWRHVKAGVAERVKVARKRAWYGPAEG